MKKLKLITDGSENNEKDTKNNLDFGMLITIIILLCAGIVMVASASSYYALSNYNNSNYFLVRQLFFGIIGFNNENRISYWNVNIFVIKLQETKFF